MVTPRSKVVDAALVALGFLIIFGAFAITPFRPLPPSVLAEVKRIAACEKEYETELNVLEIQKQKVKEELLAAFPQSLLTDAQQKLSAHFQQRMAIPIQIMQRTIQERKRIIIADCVASAYQAPVLNQRTKGK
jgi:hypothetical protein